MPVHGLFQRRVAGDDALLELAALRFAQTGLAAETYADSPGELEHVLQFVPPHTRLPTVHLNRGINLLNEQSRATVMEFASRFAGRIGGLVVHDQRDMGDQTDHLLTVLRDLNARLCELPDAPLVFLEYAAHLEPAWFVELPRVIAAFPCRPVTSSCRQRICGTSIANGRASLSRSEMASERNSSAALPAIASPVGPAPASPEPSWVASRIRWASPPESVAAARSIDR